MYLPKLAHAVTFDKQKVAAPNYDTEARAPVCSRPWTSCSPAPTPQHQHRHQHQYQQPILTDSQDLTPSIQQSFLKMFPSMKPTNAARSGTPVDTCPSAWVLANNPASGPIPAFLTTWPRLPVSPEAQNASMQYLHGLCDCWGLGFIRHVHDQIPMRHQLAAVPSTVMNAAIQTIAELYHYLQMVQSEVQTLKEEKTAVEGKLRDTEAAMQDQWSMHRSLVEERDQLLRERKPGEDTQDLEAPYQAVVKATDKLLQERATVLKYIHELETVRQILDDLQEISQVGSETVRMGTPVGEPKEEASPGDVDVVSAPAPQQNNWWSEWIEEDLGAPLDPIG